MNNSIEENIKFYKGRKIFVTGHTGFKGSWLTTVLNYLDARVMGYSLKPEKGSLYEKLEGNNSVNDVYDDLLNQQHLVDSIKSFEPEIVIHMAAYGFIKECYINPVKAYASNVLGTVNLLEAIRQTNSVKSLIVVSTDKVYLNKDDGKNFSESDELGGTTPYSCSKMCMEYVVQDYINTYFKEREDLGVGIVRASNVLAGGDHIKSRLIPSILDAMDAKSPIELRNPNQTRPWQSVLDALDAYLTIARLLVVKPKEYCGVYNIGPKAEGIKTVQWMVDTMKPFFDDFQVKEKGCENIIESKTLGLDVTKAMETLNWEPRWTLEHTLFRLVDFYKNQKTGQDEMELCENQVREYYGDISNELGK